MMDNPRSKPVKNCCHGGEFKDYTSSIPVNFPTISSGAPGCPGYDCAGFIYWKKTRTGTGFSYHAPDWEEEIYLEFFEWASEGDEGFKRNQ